MIGQEEIIALFTSFLQREGASEKTQKGYIADLKDFIDWLETHTDIQADMPVKLAMNGITQPVIKSYLKNLLENNKSIATVNRRLSTLRIFFTSAKDIGMTATNPTLDIVNVTTDQPSDPAIAETLAYWQTHLSTKGYEKSELSERITLIRDFLTWKKQKAST